MDRRFLRGFTLVEIMIVAVIIGLLAALAIPAIQKVQRRSQNSRFANDLRVFTQAFETYSLENGAWPPNAGGGVVPTGMSGTFKTDVWVAPTVVGGRWNWDKNLNGITAAVSVSSPTAATAQMTEIDALIDDGDLRAGHFQFISGRYMYILQE
ncbi:MAG: prepilin-type N-terminal cleavage/methylation domain-containing protein [Opitutae bacterium]|nr:prepilin-type N-terminal cleavage/methylation domain-containing protein [Opitutae bacterium]